MAGMGPFHDPDEKGERTIRQTTNAPLGVIAVSLAAIAVNFPGGGRGAYAQDPSQVGQWDTLATPVHGHFEIVLPTGKVLLWGNQGGNERGTLWDPAAPAAESFTPKPAPRGIRCSGFAQLPDGRSLVAKGGGPSFDVIFDPFTESWSQVAKMAHGRFYPTATSLPDGRILMTGGESNIPEVYDPIADTWEQLNAAPLNLGEYPRAFLLPSGLVFVAGVSGGMTWTFDVATDTWEQVGDCLIGFPGFHKRPAVAYEPGKILICGGGSNQVATIDFNQPAPAWGLASSMNFSRSNHNATLLPDGTILVTGGASLSTELCKPVDETWTVMASMPYPRGGHSTAPLLPDGRVGSRVDDSSVLQIYSPPYLFKGARPTILTSPGTIGYGSSFTVGPDVDSNSIGSVALLRPSSTTHSFDMGQLYVPLEFTASGRTLNVSAPADANRAPPGYYMLFIVSGNGVPSVARFVQLSGTVDLCPSDIDGSGSVDVEDLVEVLLCFGDPATPPCDTGQDITQDGFVNVNDLVEVLLAFGDACP